MYTSKHTENFKTEIQPYEMAKYLSHRQSFLINDKSL